MIMREPNVIVSRDNLSVVCVHKGRGSISCFGVLERMPRIISTILSEGTIWHSQHLFDAYVRVAFCRGLVVHSIFFDPVIRWFPAVRIVREIRTVHTRVVSMPRVRRLAPATRQRHMPLTDRLPARLDSVRLLRKVPHDLLMLARPQLRLAAPSAGKPLVELRRQVRRPHAVTAPPRAPNDALKVRVALCPRRPRDLPADFSPCLVQLPVAVATRRDRVVDVGHLSLIKMIKEIKMPSNADSPIC